MRHLIAALNEANTSFNVAQSVQDPDYERVSMKSCYAAVSFLASPSSSNIKYTRLKMMGRYLANQKEFISLLDDIIKGENSHVELLHE